jgi:hypothetical protein
LSNLWPVALPFVIPNLHCLPNNIRDPFGRPVLVLEVVAMDESAESQKRLISRAFETLRIHLKKLYEMSEDNRNPPLQYVALLDLSRLPFQTLVCSSILNRCYLFQIRHSEHWPVHLDASRSHTSFSWHDRRRWVFKLEWQSRDVDSCFNQYSCLIIRGLMLVSGAFLSSAASFTPLTILLILWLRCLLPEVALSRIFFPSNQELVQYFGPSNLPQGISSCFLDCKLHDVNDNDNQQQTMVELYLRC